MSEERIRELRERSKQVRENVAADRDQIVAEGREVLNQALASGRMVKFLFRTEDEQLLDAVDHYVIEHQLQSREQVLRLALVNLLKNDLPEINK